MNYMDEVRHLRQRFAARHSTGEYVKCLVIGEKLIQLHKRYKNTRAINFADDMFNLACVYEEVERYNRALGLYTESARVIRSVLGECADYADRLTCAAVVCGRLGDFESALSMHLDALRIKRNTCGENREVLANALYNAGNAYLDADMPEQALEHHEQALLIRSEDDISRADSLNASAYCHTGLGNIEEAKEFFEMALDLTFKIKGADSDDYIADLLHYAGFCLNGGEAGEAIKQYNKVSVLIKRRYGDAHPYYAGVLNFAADAHEKLGDMKKALNLRARTLEVMKKAVGPNHIYLANSLKSIAIGYHSIGDTAKAVKHLKGTLKIKETLIGCANDDYVKDMMLLISFYLEGMEYKKTADTLKNALKHMRAESANQTTPYLPGFNEMYILTSELAKLKDYIHNTAKTITKEEGGVVADFRDMLDNREQFMNIIKQIAKSLGSGTQNTDE